MKKNLLLCILFTSLSAALYAQIEATNHSAQYFTTDNTTAIDAHVDVINNNSFPVDINIIRTVISQNPNHEEIFCFGLYCYTPGTDTSQFTTQLAANSADFSFKATVYPAGYDGYDKLHYRFYDVNNPADSASVDIEFFFNVTTDIAEQKDEATLKFKNEVNNFTVFNYHLPSDASKARIDIHNMLGSQINSIALNEKQGMKVFTTSDLANGVYLVSLIINNKVSQSYRMIVNHQAN